MDEFELIQALDGLPLGGVHYFPSLPSTNDEAARLAALGSPDLTLVLADVQTAGRGRLGRAWQTQPDSSLAFSLALMPPFDIEAEMLPRFTALGALALVDALEGLGLEGEIKWPNDVLVHRKKVAGVLVEAQWSGEQLGPVILGVGVNVALGSEPDLPANEMNFPAASLEAELGVPVNRLVLLKTVIARLIHWRASLASREFLDAWNRSLAFRGEWVRIAENEFPAGKEFSAQVIGLAADGSLKVRTLGENEVVIQAGELRLHQ